MKERVKGIVIGTIIGALLVPTAYATVGTVMKELSYNNIKITMDGNEVTPTDANGQYVEPFIIDGTTYLPVRGVANALGLGVEWDGATNTVKLSSEKEETSADGKTKAGDVIYDEDGVKLILTEIEEKNSLNAYYFVVENTTDNDVTFQGTDFSVNDFMSPAELQFGLIQPKKKASAQVLFIKGKDSPHKKDTIEKIEFTIKCRFEGENNIESEKREKTVILNF